MGKGSAMFGGFFGKRDVVKKAWAGEMARQESMGEAWGEQPPAWLKGAVYKPNNQVGKRLPVAWDGTAGDGKADSSPPIRAGKGDGTGAAMLSAVGGGNNTGVVFAKTGKLRSTLELPEGQVQIMVDPEAARIWGAIREVSETLIEKALLGGEEGLVAKFRQELAVLQIRNPGLLYSDQLCSLLNDLSQIDLAALPRQRAVLALQKLLLTMQARMTPPTFPSSLHSLHHLPTSPTARAALASF